MSIALTKLDINRDIPIITIKIVPIFLIFLERIVICKIPIKKLPLHIIKKHTECVRCYRVLGK